MYAVGVECSRCGRTYSPDVLLTVCGECGGALLFRYDLARFADEFSLKDAERREDTFWKFIELLPLSSPKSVISLGEPYTPLLKLPEDFSKPFRNLYVKDDGRLPTGTFKARGMSVAVSKLKELGVKRVAIPSAGNAAAALSAYGMKAGIEVYAFMPRDVPENILKECAFLGAKVYLVDGLINDAAAIVGRLSKKYSWFDVSTNKQPYRFEGYKAMAFELTEQFHWDPPDLIFFPTGGGEGVIGLWKGFKELTELGWVDKTPRLVVVQSSGCAPFVEAYKRGETEIKEPWENAETIAAGLRVPKPYASYLTLKAVEETSGMAVAVDDEEILSSMKSLFRLGIYACPEAAATLAALNKVYEEGELDGDEKTLLYLTGNAMKYFDILEMEKKVLPILDRNVDSLPNH